jgi:site-specific recombinase XerD
MIKNKIIIMNQYIDYFLNYLQTEKDAASSTIHKYRADLERLFKSHKTNL